MSDRLPFRRRSGGGKHVATTGPRPSLRTVLQAGLAAALAAGLGFVAVNPALGGSTPTGPAGLAPFSSAAAAEERDRVAARQSTRDDLAQIADAAVAQVAQVRAKAQSAQLPPDRLAALDAVEQQVDELAGRLAPERLTAGRVSRGSVREGAEPSGDPAASDTSTGDAAGTDAAGADTAGTGTAGTDPGGNDPAGVDLAGTDPATTEPPAADPAAPGATTVSNPLSPEAGPASPATPGAGGATAAGTDAAGVAADAAAAGSSSADGSSGSSGSSRSSGATGTTLPGLDITDAATLAAVLPEVAADDDPAASALRDSLLALVRAAADVDAAADQAQADADAAAAAQAAADQAAAAAAAEERQRQEWADSLDGYPNGRIPASALCAPSFDPQALLRCDAAQALDRLNAAYAAVFGANLQVTDSYRSYAAQVTCRRTKGSLCARPGTSNHGWGLAVDLGGAAHSTGTEAHDWLLANARTYGWDLPEWARADGSKPEPWHWEYVA